MYINPLFFRFLKKNIFLKFSLFPCNGIGYGLFSFFANPDLLAPTATRRKKFCGITTRPFWSVDNVSR